MRHNHDAVFLGIGLMQGRKLNMEGGDLDGVITAVGLMWNMPDGYNPLNNL